MSTVPPRPKRGWITALVLVALSGVAIMALDWDLSAIASAEERAQSWQRLRSFLGSFGTPDISSSALRTASTLALETLAIALLGVALAAALAWPLALLASRSAMQDVDLAQDPDRPYREWFRVGARESARLLLDVLRGVPDIAWALLIYSFTGNGPVTGILAIAVSVAGILGKIYSELWDATDPRDYAALRSTGASRISVLLYGIQPLTARQMLSFTLMRAECAVRNASVIGIVGGGGIGGKLFEELKLGNYDLTVTLLLFTLLLTASADLAANWMRRQFRVDPDHPAARREVTLRRSTWRRGIGIGVAGLTLIGSALVLGDGLGSRLSYELSRVQWDWILSQYKNLILPSSDPQVWSQAARGAVIPLALGWLVTVASVAIAAALAFPGSVSLQLEASRFTGEFVRRTTRVLRTLLLLSARALALVFRAVPEIAWVMIFGHLLRLGLAAGFCGMVLHSAGVLARVYTETIDNVPRSRLEQARLPSRGRTFLWVAIPESFSTWKTYAMFQLEVNVRLGVVLGIIGIGGLGNDFDSAVQFWRLREAAVFLLAMVALTILLDRTSRILHAHRVACRDI